MILERLAVGPLQCNCSILGDEESREALLVDPGDDVELIMERVAKHRLKVVAIVATHGHIDHVGGLAEARQATGAPVLIHEADVFLYKMLPVQAMMIGLGAPQLGNGEDDLDGRLADGQKLTFGKLTAEVLHTPGHTPGSVCFHVGSDFKLLSGDTLFARGIGRTDLWGGSQEDIVRSIRERLYRLPDETVVYPGHGPQTTIGVERAQNPFVRV